MPSRPKALLLHLKRFILLQPSPDKHKANQIAFRKNQVSVQYPSRLQLDSTSLINKSGDAKYQLRSLVHHIGPTAYCGHYTTDSMRENKWLRFDDGLVKEMKEEDVMNCSSVKKNVYMLLYELEE